MNPMTVSSDAYDAWYHLLKEICLRGRRVRPREKPTLELTGVSLAIRHLNRNIIIHPARGLNYRFMVAEWFWIAAGLADLEHIAPYNSKLVQFSDDGKILAGAYGPRLAPHLGWVVRKLKEDPDTREAVIGIWTNSPRPSKDIPCTLSLQFLKRRQSENVEVDRLHVIATMRSSDIWLGLPYDIFVFSQLANMVAGWLECRCGSMTLQLGSSHLYETDWDAAMMVLQQQDSGGYLSSPELYNRAIPNAHSLTLCLKGQYSLAKNFLPTTLKPWSDYTRVLRSTTKGDALGILRELALAEDD